MNTQGHYTVTYHRSGLTNWREEVQAIRCSHCKFFVCPRNFSKRGDRSGQGRYNRARAVMVQHLHDKHPIELGQS